MLFIIHVRHTKNQRQWRSPELKEEDISAFKKNIVDLGYSPKYILPHAGYLINPASPDKDMADKSFNLFLDEGQRVVRLGLETINIHPGAYKEGSIEDGIKRCSLMVDRVLEEIPGLKIALENTAGAGTIIGSKFEELDAILSGIKNKDRVGFTLDTAHLFGAGYDTMPRASSWYTITPAVTIPTASLTLKLLKEYLTQEIF